MIHATCRCIPVCVAQTRASVLQHAAVTIASCLLRVDFAIAMSGQPTKMDKRLWRAMCDEFDEKIAFDAQELGRLETEMKTVNDRMAVNRRQLAELTCNSSDGVDAAAPPPGQSTLHVKRARLAAVRSIGTQTE